MAYPTLRTLFAAVFALIISAGQFCACATAFSAIEGSAPHQAETAHAGEVQSHTEHGHDAPAGECEHCTRQPYLKASTNTDLSASLSAPSSFQKLMPLDNGVSPFSNTKALHAQKLFALHDPPTRTPVSLKIRLLI